MKSPLQLILMATAAIAAVLAVSALTGCSGIPVMLTASYEGQTADGNQWRVGVGVPLTGSGKQPVKGFK